ncbi:histidine kinase N-terminal 7TM domain-containing protein [Pseudobacteroides cellulosolvens]|uniref:histidine kinase n=1 Tax=Pseudobacteroides cellulosolvens ATCC 35603 = DSM 2933 TaxID=398512 RepID=A0A0L6JFZ0_9FIRM|nr:histidine kinase N-terminal 7TM domain-containing protein [Pseudobacteroides cellulosolvens]KNY24761.1 integral membrane sensor signal transduction histidine kinase [Pseudobacteroides cellulosolvens ATCC 35603 = DSM 2933]
MEIKIVLNLRSELLLISILTTLIGILFLAINAKRNRVTYLFGVFQFAALLWSIFEFLEVYSGDTKSKWLVTQLKFFPISFVGAIWLIFSLYYSEQKILKNKKTIPVLLFTPIIFYIFCVTNNYHYLYFNVFNFNVTGFGYIFWMHVIESYIYVLIGIVLLIKQNFKLSKDTKQIFISIAMIVPLIINILHVIKVIYTPFDVTPLFFPLSMTIFAIATYRMNFLNILPFAYKRIFENLEEAVIVVDNQNKIINFNEIFKNTFSKKYEFNIDTDFNIFTQSMRLNTKNNHAIEKSLRILEGHEGLLFDGEIELDIPQKRVFQLKVRRIFDNNKELAGRCILFQDITEYKELIEDVEYKNEELTAINEELTTVNEELNKYLSIVEELTLSKERNRIAREVHDTLGHSLTMIMMITKIIKANLSEDKRVDAVKRLVDVEEISQNALSEIRNSIKGLRQEEENSRDIVYAIEKIIKYSSSSNVKIGLAIMGQEYYPDVLNSRNIEKLVEISSKVCREAVTNAIRHGKAGEISIFLKFCNDKIKIYILDNGNGCQSIKKGYGLMGMEERVKEAAGTIAFGAGGEMGFNIHIELPLEG